MKIITLIENLVYKPGLIAEHGLSLLIDTGQKMILFDTGQSHTFISNAQKLNIDIKQIDTVVISHGHFDHTGGLPSFLQINKKATVYAKKEIFNRKYKNEKYYIGTDQDLSKSRERFSFTEEITEIAPDIFILPDIRIFNKADTSFLDFNVQSPDGFIPDRFEDELFLVITKNKKLNILSSCSHRGISNILRTAIIHFNLPVNMVLGGFHLKDSGNAQCEIVYGYLKETGPGLIGVCHCTGVDKYVKLKSDFGDRVFYNMTGNFIEI